MYPRVDKIETGKRIRNLMKVRGLKPTDIQDKLSLCCVQTVYKWMRGESISSIDILYSLCALLRVNMDSLLVGNKEQIVLENMNRGL